MAWTSWQPRQSVAVVGGIEGAAWRALIEKLRTRREALGMSQVQLDEILGLTRGHIGRFENYERRPTGWNLCNWVFALGGTLDAAFQEDMTNALSTNVAARVSDREPAPA